MNNIFIKDGIPTMQVNDPAALVEYQLIDVRTSEEFTGELAHIKGAKLVTIGADLDVFLEDQDKHKNILFICRSGVRSARATEQAMHLGYTKVFNMEGGMIAWNNNKFPIEI